MKPRLILALALAFGLPQASLAGGPVVVELYTSQGCSSCPPADAILGELAGREDVIALALHVDYWDYIGWKDDFALPAHALRQRRYARAAGNRMIYTPQMVIGGEDHVVGHRPLELARILNHHANMPHPVTASISRVDGASVRVTASAGEPLRRRAAVQVLRYNPKATVHIKRGENAGRTIKYHNIVSAWEHSSRWDGRRPLDMNVEISGEGPVVVLVQEGNNGPILAAARVK